MSDVRIAKYIVVIESGASVQASVGKLNYSGERYEMVASGKYADIYSLVAALNRAVTA